MPLRVRYSLTPYGMTLVPVLDVLCTWGREHLKREPCACAVFGQYRMPIDTLDS